jgi:hypothetical protein
MTAVRMNTISSFWPKTQTTLQSINQGKRQIASPLLPVSLLSRFPIISDQKAILLSTHTEGKEKKALLYPPSCWRDSQ